MELLFHKYGNVALPEVNNGVVRHLLPVPVPLFGTCRYSSYSNFCVFLVRISSGTSEMNSFLATSGFFTIFL